MYLHNFVLISGQSYEIKLKRLGDLTEYEGYLRVRLTCVCEAKGQIGEMKKSNIWGYFVWHIKGFNATQNLKILIRELQQYYYEHSINNIN